MPTGKDFLDSVYRFSKTFCYLGTVDGHFPVNPNVGDVCFNDDELYMYAGESGWVPLGLGESEDVSDIDTSETVAPVKETTWYFPVESHKINSVVAKLLGPQYHDWYYCKDHNRGTLVESDKKMSPHVVEKILERVHDGENIRGCSNWYEAYARLEQLVYPEGSKKTKIKDNVNLYILKITVGNDWNYINHEWINIDKNRI